MRTDIRKGLCRKVPLLLEAVAPRPCCSSAVAAGCRRATLVSTGSLVGFSWVTTIAIAIAIAITIAIADLAQADLGLLVDTKNQHSFLPPLPLLRTLSSSPSSATGRVSLPPFCPLQAAVAVAPPALLFSLLLDCGLFASSVSSTLLSDGDGLIVVCTSNDFKRPKLKSLPQLDTFFTEGFGA
ncbi:hypothetical protein PanWU01x14_162620 [Parasponia andersonii]|uniref:Uncharacterized protein n=1 Tax=Parasponia andersonii TaxID=3476 RepID=A0A2P5CD60_PARAD|nr:hypothetical protein PanWU01x14_162620 [Parasponia andersonii]